MHTFATDIPCTILISNQFLTHSKAGISRDGQPLTKTLLRLYGGQKKLARKIPFREKYDRKSG